MKINIIFHSIYGHIYRMAEAVAAGARIVPGAEVALFQVPETLSPDVLREMNGVDSKKSFAHIPPANMQTLTEADALIFGTPTYFGKMSSQMAAYLDQSGSLWVDGSLINKVGSVFTSTADQNGGQEETIRSFQTTLLHHGMIVVGLPSAPSYKELHRLDQVSGGTCYGASAIVGEGAGKELSANELAIAQLQGRHVAEITRRLVRGKNGA